MRERRWTRYPSHKNCQVASNDPLSSGAKYLNAAGVRAMPPTQVGHLSAIVTIALFPLSIKKHRASTSSRTGEFNGERLQDTLALRPQNLPCTN